jgi:hypothetical protein
MRSNVRNGINLGLDLDLFRHRALLSATLGSLGFCAGTLAGVSVAEASLITLQDAARALFEARMDETLLRDGLLETLKHVDPKLFAEQLVTQTRFNVEGVFDQFAQHLPETEDGFGKKLIENPATQLANDLIKETEEKMDWLSPLLKTAALGGTVGAAAYVLHRASTAFKAWFVTTSEEYFQKRKELLVSGQAVKADILETRERAVLAYARLVAFERGGAQATLETTHTDFAKAALADLPLGEVLREIEEKVRDLTLKRRGELEGVIFRGEDRSSLGPIRSRDIVREVIMNRSPDVVDPFAPAPGGPAPS